jgi:hypothetical protein
MQVSNRMWRTALTISLSLGVAGCDRPSVLTRKTASAAIEATAEFQHKTKLRFLIGQAEGLIPGACHNFSFRADRRMLVEQYLKSNQLKFFHFGNQSAPFGMDYGYSNELSLNSDGILSDHIERCVEKDVQPDTGEYELTIGKPVVKVNGILKQGHHAHVDFTWHFESMTELGKSLGFIQGTKQSESDELRFSDSERSQAPFWDGSAEMAEYDDGWRVISLKVPWGYLSDDWPDQSFNWGAFDENENVAR